MSKRKSLFPGTLLAPIPPAMVTVGDYDHPNVLTIAWTGILSTIPPRTYISVRPSRHSYSILKEKGEFVINLPSVSMARETDFVGIYTGAKVDKFEKCGLKKHRSEKVAPPIIDGCPIALECKVCQVLPMGSHDVFIADIVSVSCDESIIDSEGKLRYDRADLLAYGHGEYYALGEVVGRFGFSTDKVKKPAKEKKTEKKVDKPIKKQTAEKKPVAEKKPFYKDAPRGKTTKKKPTDKNKGAPHGKRVGGKK